MKADDSIISVDIDGNAERVAFSNQPAFQFRGPWLRDRCGCHACVHPRGGQASLTAQNLSGDMGPGEAALQAGGLRVTRKDGHLSRYTPGFPPARKPDDPMQHAVIATC